MAAYIVFEANVHDTAWREKYAEPTKKLIEKHGGRYLALSPALVKLEGDRALPNVGVIIEFPSVEAAKAWHSDPDYQPLLALRQSGSNAEAVLVPGLD